MCIRDSHKVMRKYREAELNDMHRIFDEFDADKSGYIDIAELSQASRYRGDNLKNDMLLEEVTMVRAPIIFAICRQAAATPPPTPTISTLSADCRGALPNIIRQAVR